MRLLLSSLFLGLAVASLSPARAAADDCGDAAALVRLAYPQARKSADGASFTLEPHTSITLTLPEGDNSFGLVCKIWPAHDDLLLVSVPLIDKRPIQRRPACRRHRAPRARQEEPTGAPTPAPARADER